MTFFSFSFLPGVTTTLIFVILESLTVICSGTNGVSLFTRPPYLTSTGLSPSFERVILAGFSALTLPDGSSVTLTTVMWSGSGSINTFSGYRSSPLFRSSVFE